MVTEGQLEILGSNDVLTLAVGTPEHSGRVRGLPNGVTPTQIFKTPRSRKNNAQQDETIRRLEQDIRQSIEEKKKNAGRNKRVEGAIE